MKVNLQPDFEERCVMWVKIFLFKSKSTKQTSLHEVVKSASRTYEPAQALGKSECHQDEALVPFTHIIS